MTKNLLIALTIIISFLSAQIDTVWTRRENGSGDSTDIPTAMVLDNQGNLYLTGYSQGNGTAYDFLTIKYSPTGQKLWAKRFNGSGNFDDKAYDIAIDDSNYIYVGGIVFNSSRNFLIIKYSADGDTVWTRSPIINGAVVDQPTKIAIRNGSLYFAGTINRTATSEDYIIIKYTTTGDFVWINTYDGYNGIDRLTGITTDDSNNVIVTGYSYGTGTGYDYATIKYSPLGETVWAKRYNGTANNQDYARAICTDNFGNIYVAGEIRNQVTRYDFGIIKYRPDGETLWTRTYNGNANNDDFPKAMATDAFGNVYVCGYSMGSGTYYDYATVKYSNVGELVWVKRYDGPSNSFDRANAITVDNYGNIYITGASEGAGSQFDYLTLKYNNNGDTIWQIRFDSGINGIDEPVAILTDNLGNIYVTGFSASTSHDYDFLTIKYSEPNTVREFHYILSPETFFVTNIARNKGFAQVRLRKNTELTMRLYNINGELVKEIIAGNFGAGEHKFDFDVSEISSGVYLCCLELLQTSVIKKLIVMH